MKSICFFDFEVARYNRVADIGAIGSDGREFHSSRIGDFFSFASSYDLLCGHNIIEHDCQYLKENFLRYDDKKFIDTLYMSPILFPKHPYHKLVKDDKLCKDDINNPFNDAKKSRDLFFDEYTAFDILDKEKKKIYYNLLKDDKYFSGFFDLFEAIEPIKDIVKNIQDCFCNKICSNVAASLEDFVNKYPIDLAYALSQIDVLNCDRSITPYWVLHNYKHVQAIVKKLCNDCCFDCDYCNEKFDARKNLKRYFGYDGFRQFCGQNLQLDAVNAAIKDESILVIFPTGGGKSVTFQLPAIIAGENSAGLTVVISPLQSLMKDQVDNLEKKQYTKAVTINGSIDPIYREKARQSVEDGYAQILYISPESLRNESMGKLLQKRNVVRFVIDEAHCFSAWGQDFRVDYQYIGEFIKNLSIEKNVRIPVSCFTATAKQKVILDIKSYFNDWLGVELKEFTTSIKRENLHYNIISVNSDDDKYNELRRLINESQNKSCIIYTARTKTCEKLSQRLSQDGINAIFYHGQMERQDRVYAQDRFMDGEIKVIVATTAFGMGVDKSDVCLVVHYDISDSLENYIQEAGRAGRDQNLLANCYVLYNEDDLNKHFRMLNQTKITQKEIIQIWNGIKKLTSKRNQVSKSALDIARAAGWDDSLNQIETRVKTAIQALEHSKFLKRGHNKPMLYASSLLVKNLDEAKQKIYEIVIKDDENKDFYDCYGNKQPYEILEEFRNNCEKIINILINSKANLVSKKIKTEKQKNIDIETRVDYIAERIDKSSDYVVKCIYEMKNKKILEDFKDLIVHLDGTKINNKSQSKVKKVLENHILCEEVLFDELQDEEKTYNMKELNEKISFKHNHLDDINYLNRTINYFDISRLIKRKKENGKHHYTIIPNYKMIELKNKAKKRYKMARFCIDYFYKKLYSNIDIVDEKRVKEILNTDYGVYDEKDIVANIDDKNDKFDKNTSIAFSVFEITKEYSHNILGETVDEKEVEDCLFWLSKIGALEIQGGFLVIYNLMEIYKKEQSGRRYTNENYKQLDDYYKNKCEQIHIVGEYAKKMIDDYNGALQFVDDYFTMNYEFFKNKYYKGLGKILQRPITEKKFRQLFGELSLQQQAIINDKDSNVIVVLAGPGSGKTKVLTHKLASLVYMEDTKTEQMLMLTFSRSAAVEFKKRLINLVGEVAFYIQISTFHSYCFDLLGKVGGIKSGKSNKIIKDTIEKIQEDKINFNITKTVLVIDEAQDISEDEYELLKLIKEKNEGIRIIAVGDDDQNIFETLRGSSSKYMRCMLEYENSKQYELIDNYRSKHNIVSFSNQYVNKIKDRLKSTNIVSKSLEDGKIIIFKMNTKNLETAVVKKIIEIMPNGKTLVMAKTNEEVATIVYNLNKNNINAKQLKTNENFSLKNLVEIRAFFGYVTKGSDGATFLDDDWNEAKQKLYNKFSRSNDLPRVQKMLKDFEDTNKAKYRSDFEYFLQESKLEDFENYFESSVVVSTIESAKGRECDNVFLTRSDFVYNDEQKRKNYVAITRVKNNLYIFDSANNFDGIITSNMSVLIDNNNYEISKNICLSCGHKDIVLSDFIYKQNLLDNVFTGDTINATNEGVFFEEQLICKYSKSFKEKLYQYLSKNYKIQKATVRHIVYYYNEDLKKEHKILLFDLELEKNN